MAMLDAIDDGSCKGHVIMVGKNKGKLSRSAKVAVRVCETAHGPRPPGYVCRHLCANDSYVKARGEDAYVCIHPAHIEWSTSKQNNQDAAHNISAAKKGMKQSPEHIANLSAARLGKKHKQHKKRALETKKRKPYKKRSK